MARSTKGKSAKRLTAKPQRKDLEALAALHNDAIDLSDAPELSDWSTAIVGRFYRPVKEAVTIRLDADVLAWLRSHGRGYQTRINRVLRNVMEAQQSRSTRGKRNGRGDNSSPT
jgi:uncharacterized protein (DUF4415 family)